MVYRNTKQKNTILTTIDTYGHLTVEEILSLLKNENISIATIYRNLNTLTLEGKIRKVSTEDKVVYETIKETHYHFECTTCHQIIDIDPSHIKISTNHSLAKKAKKDIFLYGVCESCQTKLEGEN